MIKAALLQNIQTRPDVFGSRHFAPLPGVRMPLPTLPAIVGSHTYMPRHTADQSTAFYKQRFGSQFMPSGIENPGTQYYRMKLGMVRKMIPEPVSGVSEPSLNNPQR